MCPGVARSDRNQSVRVPLRVLIAEDSEDDARLLLRELARAGFDPAHQRVDSRAAMQAALDRHTWDLVIGDYSMPEFSGPAALALLRAHDPDTPFIFVSGSMGEDVAVEAMKAGAQDFLTKGNLRRLIPAIERELREAEVRRERRRGQTALLERARLAELTSDVGIALTQSGGLRAMLQLCAEALVRHLDVALARIWTLDDAGEVLDLQASAGMYTHIDGAHSHVPLGCYKIGMIARDRRPQLTNQVVGDPQIHDQAWVRREGLVAFAGYPLVLHDRVLGVMAMFACHALSEFVPKALGSVASAVTVGIERKRAEQALRRSEEQLRQAQKMEAVGRLAGGIAHDFNNLLTVITSYGDLLLEDLAPDDSRRDDVDQIRKAAEGAAALTRQLLAFSRQQVLEPKVVDLRAILAGTEKLLRRLIGADVHLAMPLAPDLGAVKADPGQLEQIIINLAVGPRDRPARAGGAAARHGDGAGRGGCAVGAAGDAAGARALRLHRSRSADRRHRAAARGQAPRSNPSAADGRRHARVERAAAGRAAVVAAFRDEGAVRVGICGHRRTRGRLPPEAFRAGGARAPGARRAGRVAAPWRASSSSTTTRCCGAPSASRSRRPATR